MYFEILAGFDKFSDLNEKQRKIVEGKRDLLIREFMKEQTLRTPDKGTLVYLKEDEEGCLYRFTYNLSKKIYGDYFFSDFEYGAIRKDKDDHRFDVDWKEFMLTKLIEVDFEIAQNYMKEWNDKYRAFCATRKGNPEKILAGENEYVESACNGGSHILENRTQNL